MIRTSLTLLIVFFIETTVNSQDYKFGKVSKSELEEKYYPADSSASAAYLFKKKQVSYLYNGDQGWKLITEVHERVKLYTKEGFDYGTKNEYLYTSGGNDEKIIGIKGLTYELIDGKIIKYKLDKKDIFKEKSSETRVHVTFTMPNLSEGSIVEWKYKIESPYETFIDDVILQHTIPIKKLDVVVKVPEYYKFKTNLKGFLYVDVQQKFINKTINFSKRSAVQAGKVRTERSSGSVDLKEKYYTIKKENIPALEIEPFVNNINNYRSACQFELIKYHYPGEREYPFATTWERVSKKIFESPSFGREIDKQSHFKEELSSLLDGITNDSQKITTIYQFVKSKIKWNRRNGKYTSSGTRKSYKEGEGNVADINLNLVSMLRYAGLEANPVLVSTRANGVFFFPTLKGFNYVIASVIISNKIILLDATELYAVPNQLPLRAMNWEGRLVKKDGTSLSVNLAPEKMSSEDNFISVVINQDLEASGMLRKKYTNLNALTFRNKYSSLKEEEVIEEIEENNSIETERFKIQNKTSPEKPISITTKFFSDDLVEEINDKIYITPLLFLAEKENPFKIDDRKYPVDFGTTWREKSNVSITIPEGYEVESIPESLSINLTDNFGVLRYQISLSGEKLKITSIVQLNYPIIPAIFYKELKEFYKQVVEKQSEKIVLRKI